MFPQGAHPYSLDIATAHARFWLKDEDGFVLTLYDTWPLLEQPDLFADMPAWYWAPVDHAPPPPKVTEWCRNHDIIAMSEFGRDQLTTAGAPPGYTIPHAIETDTFKPTESDIRTLMDVPQDAHLTVAVMANIGQSPVRKSWFENLMAWRIFADQHDDAYIYIHTQLRHPRGVDLASFISMWGLPADRVRIVDQHAYAAGMTSAEQLAAILSASDVMLMATAGEGFGIPAVEAQACGTPVIATDFSAQREVVGVGWKVPYVTFWDYQQAAAQALPDVHAIKDALDDSYSISKDRTAAEDMSRRAVEFAQRYDADKVYDEQWRPFLADREAKPNRAQRRKRKNKR